jgi:hypothetical protein
MNENAARSRDSSRWRLDGGSSRLNLAENRAFCGRQIHQTTNKQQTTSKAAPLRQRPNGGRPPAHAFDKNQLLALILPMPAEMRVSGSEKF